MKRIFILVLTAVLIICLSGVDALYSQTQKEVKKSTEEGKSKLRSKNHGRYFVDKNMDGVCDNFKTGTGKGLRGNSRSRGRNYADNNKDGICDNFPQGRRSGVAGPNFVDKNNDGICDNRPEGMGKGKGMGKKSGNCDGTRKSWRGSR